MPLLFPSSLWRILFTTFFPNRLLNRWEKLLAARNQCLPSELGKKTTRSNQGKPKSKHSPNSDTGPETQLPHLPC